MVTNANTIKTAFLCFIIRDAIFIVVHPLLCRTPFHLIIILDTVLGIQQTVVFRMLDRQQIIPLCCFLGKVVRKMSEKMDRRKQYTRMVLKESLLDLLKEKSIASITIKEICTKADINRSTFYAHYSSQYDLLDSIDDEFTEDMVKTLNQYNFSKEDEAYQMTEKIFEYIASKSDICRILLSENTEVQFQKKGMMIAKEYILKNFIPHKQVDAETFEYLSIFFVSGSIYMIKNWLESGMNKTPKEMAGLLNEFLNRGLRGQAR